MARKKPTQKPAVEFTQRERSAYLYHTAEEMRAINDRADARIGNDTEPEDTDNHRSVSVKLSCDSMSE